MGIFIQYYYHSTGTGTLHGSKGRGGGQQYRYKYSSKQKSGVRKKNVAGKANWDKRNHAAALARL